MERDHNTSPESAANEHGYLRQFLILDRIGALGGLLALVIANGFFVKEPLAWLLVLPLVALVIALQLAIQSFDQGRTTRALVLAGGANWMVAIIVAGALPVLWPVMVVTVLVPMVLAAPYLHRASVGYVLAATALTACLVAIVGLLNDDGGVVEDMEDEFELALVIGALAAQTVPVSVIAWQNNQRQLHHVELLVDLNDDLRFASLELRQSRQRVVEAGDVERRRIERDLHDGAQQRLVALGVRLRLLESQLDGDSYQKETISTLVNELDEAVKEVRNLAHGIYPPLLQTQGLGPTLRSIARRAPWPVETDLAEIDRFDSASEATLYFAGLEALANAAKHAPEAPVHLALAEAADSVTLVVSDTGPGFDPAVASSSHGLQNMEDRLAAAGGSLHIVSAPGRGSTITATVPKRRAEATLQ